MAECQIVDTTHTKIFVGGLPWTTRNEGLRRFYQQFGEIIHVNVVCDSQTDRSKGYGFVTFKDAESARRACVDGNPIIDGRRANCNLASDGENVNHNQFNIIAPHYDDLCYLSSTFIQSQQQLANLHQPLPTYFELYYWNEHYQQYLPLRHYYESQQYYELYQPYQQFYEHYQPQPQYNIPQPMNASEENKAMSQASISSSSPSTSSSLPSTPKSSLDDEHD